MFRATIRTASISSLRLCKKSLAQSSRRFTTSTPPSANAKKEVRGPVTYMTLLLAGVVSAGLIVYYQIEKENRREQATNKVITTVGKASLGGPWVLVDQDGIPRTNASYFGQHILLYFGFSHCPDICPSELVKVGKVIDALGDDLAHALFFVCYNVFFRANIILIN